uniref:Uncharacterized protein n=1 Tax=Clytia hemisphaerica TaxID=252671 RepID=A0A7M5WYC5_9CNID
MGFFELVTNDDFGLLLDSLTVLFKLPLPFPVDKGIFTFDLSDTSWSMRTIESSLIDFVGLHGCSFSRDKLTNLSNFFFNDFFEFSSLNKHFENCLCKVYTALLAPLLFVLGARCSVLVIATDLKTSRQSPFIERYGAY